MTWVDLIPAILAFLAAATGLLKSMQNKTRLDEIHVLVNANMAALTERVAQLTAVLQDAKVPVPPAPAPAAIEGGSS